MLLMARHAWGWPGVQPMLGSWVSVGRSGRGHGMSLLCNDNDAVRKALHTVPETQCASVCQSRQVRSPESRNILTTA